MEVLFKMRDIQSGHRSIDIEIFYFEMRLVLEQQIMHRPEAVLQSGGLRGFRGELCMRVFLRPEGNAGIRTAQERRIECAIDR